MIGDFTGETTRCERLHGICGTAKQERVTLSQSILRKFRHVIAYEILVFNLTSDFQRSWKNDFGFQIRSPIRQIVFRWRFLFQHRIVFVVSVLVKGKRK